MTADRDVAFLRAQGFEYDVDRDSWVGPIEWSPGLRERLGVVVAEPRTQYPGPNRASRRASRRRRGNRR